MSLAAVSRTEAGSRARPLSLLWSGLRRGALLVFLPVFVAGQAVAWLTYLVSGWYRPWSWFKIGLAETLASVRVGFTSDARGPTVALAGIIPTQGTLQLALGALLIAVVVLSFRAGRQQADGLGRRPSAAAISGAAVGLGVAIPMLVIAIPVTLGFPQFGIEHLEPVLWQAFVLPLVVAGACGAAGGVTSAREALVARVPWGPRLNAAARGGFAAMCWGLALAFAGFLALAALEPGATGAYARYVDRSGGSGAALVVQHALLLPNQSSMILDTAMGVPTTMTIADTTLVELRVTGVEAIGSPGALVAALVHAPSTGADFPLWCLAFLLVPAAATVIGGRTAGGGASGRRGEAAARGALAGVIYAALCTIAAWFAAIVLPLFPASIGGSIRLGTDPIATAFAAAIWGVLGSTIGALSVSSRTREEAT